jgi:hypothetical protein
MQLPVALQSIKSCISYGLVDGLVTDTVHRDLFVASLLLLCRFFVAPLLLLFLFVVVCVCACVSACAWCVCVCVCVCVVVFFFSAAHHQSTTFC